MTVITFIDKVTSLFDNHQNRPGILFAPRIDRLPLSIQRYDEPLLPFGKAVINAAQGIAAAYIFDLAAYLRTGAAGAIALERTIDYAGAVGNCITVLHGPFDRADFVVLFDESSFGVDALTIASLDAPMAYLSRPDRGVFVVSNSKADSANLPENVGVYLISEQYLQIHPDHQQKLQFQVIDVHTLYESSDDDFQNSIRNRLSQENRRIDMHD